MPYCDRCSELPQRCPCLCSWQAWYEARYPSTTLDSGAVVKVYRDPHDLRVAIQLPLKPLTRPDQNDAFDVAKRWQEAIIERVGTSVNTMMKSPIKVEKLEKTYPTIAKEVNDRIVELARTVLKEGESTDSPGDFFDELLRALRLWFPKEWEARSNAAEVLDILAEEGELSTESYPVDGQRIKNGLQGVNIPEDTSWRGDGEPPLSLGPVSRVLRELGHSSLLLPGEAERRRGAEMDTGGMPSLLSPAERRELMRSTDDERPRRKK